MPTTRSSRNAVSGVTLRRPRTISFRRGKETPNRMAHAYWASLSGQRTPATLAYGGDESSIRNGVDVRAWRHWL